MDAASKHMGCASILSFSGALSVKLFFPVWSGLVQASSYPVRWGTVMVPSREWPKLRSGPGLENLCEGRRAICYRKVPPVEESIRQTSLDRHAKWNTTLLVKITVTGERS